MSQSEVNGGESFSASELNCKVNIKFVRELISTQLSRKKLFNIVV